MNSITVVVGIVQLIVAVFFAVGAICLALTVPDKFTRELSEAGELKKGNIAVALEMAGVIIAVALIIQSGITGITAALG